MCYTEGMRAKFTRRAFLGNTAAFALFGRALAAAGPSARDYERPDGRAADFVLCRRLYIDLCGRLPTPAEVTAFTADPAPDKVARLVDALLASGDFADYWSMRYCDFLRVKSEFPINLWPNAVYVYHRRIHAAVAQDEPWDEFARALLSARGSNFRVPEVNFLRAVARRTPEGLSEAASLTFLLDPTERYARYFTRVAWKSTREWKEEIVHLARGAQTEVPEAFLGVCTGARADDFRAAMPRRVHAWIFGSMPERTLLADWVRAYVAGGLRLKPLLRHVCLSAVYQAGPITGGFPPKRLEAEVLDDIRCEILGGTRAFTSIAPEPFTYLPPARRTVLVEDGSITSAFLLLFGRPARDTGRLEERNNEITAKQRLYLFNSGSLWQGLVRMVQEKSFQKLAPAEKIRTLFLRFLARPPTPRELALVDGKTRLAPRELAWQLLNSQEFLYRI